MNNNELELKIQEILSEKNFFNMVEKTIDFEKEYKISDFFKRTKMPLKTLMKEYKIYSTLDAEKIFAAIQEKIDKLDLKRINEIIDQLGNTFAQENQDIMDEIAALDLKNFFEEGKRVTQNTDLDE